MKIVVKQLETNHNVSKESDLQVFFKWTAFLVWIVVLFFLFFLSLGNILVNFISLEDEEKYFWALNYDFNVNEVPEKTERLRKFLWEDFEYEVLVISSEESNAFALAGWKIGVTDKFLEEIEYENSLLLIVWHEVGHIENRDLFKRIVSAAPIKILLYLVWAWWDFDVFFIGSSAYSVYSKSVEYKADESWLEFLYAKKWEVWCALGFFEKDSWLLEDISSFVSDHPMTSARVDNINKIIKEKWYKEDEECKRFEF